MKTNLRVRRFLNVAVIILAPFTLSGCAEYFATALAIVLIPEMIFGGILIIALIVGLIGIIIRSIFGDDEK